MRAFCHGLSNNALQLTARWHVSQVTCSFSVDSDRAPQLKAIVLRSVVSLETHGH